jgi:hypothetical protein
MPIQIANSYFILRLGRPPNRSILIVRYPAKTHTPITGILLHVRGRNPTLPKTTGSENRLASFIFVSLPVAYRFRNMEHQWSDWQAAGPGGLSIMRH